MSDSIRVIIERDDAGGITTWGPLISSVLVAVITAIAVIVAARRNAQAIIDAESNRHDHDLDREARAWHRNATAEGYFRLTAGCTAAFSAVKSFRWYHRPRHATGPHESTNESAATEELEHWNQAVEAVRLATATVRATGNAAVADGARDAMEQMNLVIEAVFEALEAADQNPPVPYVEAEVGKAAFEAAERLIATALETIRVELRAASPTTARANAA